VRTAEDACAPDVPTSIAANGDQICPGPTL